MKKPHSRWRPGVASDYQRCATCGFEVDVVERRWLGVDPYLTTSNPDRYPLGYSICNPCWWKQRLREIDKAAAMDAGTRYGKP